jgi:hypothetical protein
MSMSFVSVIKNVGKIQKSITYWLSMIFIWFFIFGRLIMITLDKWVPFFYYINEFYFFYFIVFKEYMKIVIVTSIYGHRIVQTS